MKTETMQKFKFLSKDKKPNKNENPHDELLNDNVSIISERKLVSRNAVICSSGKDKYHYDSERAEVPTRPVDLELEGTSLATVSNGPCLSVHRQMSHKRRSNNNSPVELSNSSPVLHRERASYVRRDTVVKRFEFQPSVCVNGKFQNPWPSYKPPSFTSILKLGFSNDKSNVSSKQDLNLSLPILKPNIHNPAPEDSFRITWIGQSTILAEFDNITVLTDPIFSERASPSQVIGPKRYRPPPCTVSSKSACNVCSANKIMITNDRLINITGQIHDLPSNLDAVVISHSHYDHLDLNTVVMLNARYGSDLRWFIPLGLADWFNRIGCDNVVELDWWEENCVADKSDVSFVLTPCQHWSKRTLTDDNKSLWGSWVIKGPKFRFFFIGDTGYCNIFKQIGLAYGPFDVAAIPIGSYEPRWYMKHQHVNPSEAVKIHRDIKSKFSVAIHWGTFAISNEYFLEPPMRLREAIEKSNIDLHEFITFMHGETRTVTTEGKVETTPRNRIFQ